MNPKHDPLFDLSHAMAGMEHDRMQRENEELKKRVEALERGEIYGPPQPNYGHQEEPNWKAIIIATVIFVGLLMVLCLLSNSFLGLPQ